MGVLSPAVLPTMTVQNPCLGQYFAYRRNRFRAARRRPPFGRVMV
jgi:hypothetical protein